MPSRTSPRTRTGVTAGLLAAATVVAMTAGFGGAASATTTNPDSLASLYAQAPTPYMGWNSWFSYGRTINETTIKAEADAIVSTGLKDAGYSIVWLDDGWWSGARNTDGSFTISSTQWPSGMKGLADYIHGLGLKAGIYTDAGYNGCGGTNKGSAGHVQQDIDQFAAWGYDAVKIDHCGGNITGMSDQETYEAYRHAILNNASHRQIIFDICRWQFDPYMPATGNAYRTALDIASVNDDGSYTAGNGQWTWNLVMRNLDTNAQTPWAQGPGHYNDPDYLLTGHNLDSVPTASTDAASRTQMSMWAIMGSPLVLGTRPSTLSAASIATLTNSEVIAVDRDPMAAMGVKVAEPATGLQVWSKRLSTPGTRAIALFNRTGSSGSITVNLTDAGLTGSVALRDLWQKSDLGSFTGSYTVTVPAYSTVLLKATGQENVSWANLDGNQSASPAIAANGAGGAYSFHRGTDGALYEKTLNGNAWSSSWANLGGPTSGTFTGTPAAVSAAPGQLDVVVRGTDNALYHRTYAAGSWGSWENLGGTLSDSPAISAQNANQVDVFTRGTDGALYQKTWNGSSWSSSWTNLGGPTGGTFTGAPAAVSGANGRIDLAVRGTDNALYHRVYSGGAWGSWENLGGTLADSPAITSQNAGQLDVIIRGSDNTLSERTWNGSAWSSWTSWGGPTGGTMSAAPSAVAVGGGQILLNVRGTDNRSYVELIADNATSSGGGTTPPPTSLNGTHTLTISGKSLDDPGWSTSDGTQLVTWGTNGGANQNWVFTQQGDGSYEIKNAYSNKCIDDPGWSTSSGTQLIQWSCNGQDNQHWVAARQSDGTYTFANKYSNLLLTTASGSDGALITQATASSGALQKWTLG